MSVAPAPCLRFRGRPPLRNRRLGKDHTVIALGPPAKDNLTNNLQSFAPKAGRLIALAWPTDKTKPHQENTKTRPKRENRLEQDFGVILRNWRNEAGMSLRKLAGKTGMSFAYLAKIERGELAPPAEKKLLRLAKVLGRSPDDLLDSARRLPADVIQIAQREPSRYASLLRMTKKLSRAELDLIIQHVRQEVVRIKDENKTGTLLRIQGNSRRGINSTRAVGKGRAAGY